MGPKRIEVSTLLRTDHNRSAILLHAGRLTLYRDLSTTKKLGSPQAISHFNFTFSVKTQLGK